MPRSYLCKKRNLNTIDNLRPISLLCGLSKAFEKILKGQMCAYLSQHKLLSDHQAGFREGHGVNTALLRVYDDIAVVVDNKQNAVLLLLDFSKAFDTISHRRLCFKLGSHFQFQNSAIELIRSYLTGRTQSVHCGISRSCKLAVTSGVPQGSVLGPLLFSMYINDLPNVLRYCSVQMFADDVQLICIHLDLTVEELIGLINQDLHHLVHWTKRNSLKLNPGKTKAMLFGPRRVPISELPAITIEGFCIELSSEANNLGLVFQDNLEWEITIAVQCGKVYACLRTLRAISMDLPVQTKLQLFKSLILPHFMFCDVVHLNMSAAMASKLEVALNDCARYIYNIDRRTSVRYLQKQLLGCPFRCFYAMRSCLFLHKILHRQAPRHLFVKLTSSRSRRTNNLIVPPHHTSKYGETFFVRSVVYWNMLPPELKLINSEAMFKQGCLLFFNQ